MVFAFRLQCTKNKKSEHPKGRAGSVQTQAQAGKIKVMEMWPKFWGRATTSAWDWTPDNLSYSSRTKAFSFLLFMRFKNDPLIYKARNELTVFRCGWCGILLFVSLDSIKATVRKLAKQKETERHDFRKEPKIPSVLPSAALHSRLNICLPSEGYCLVLILWHLVAAAAGQRSNLWCCWNHRLDSSGSKGTYSIYVWSANQVVKHCYALRLTCWRGRRLTVWKISGLLLSLNRHQFNHPLKELRGNCCLYTSTWRSPYNVH